MRWTICGPARRGIGSCCETISEASPEAARPTTAVNMKRVLHALSTVAALWMVGVATGYALDVAPQSPSAAQGQAAEQIQPQAIRAHLEFLADDLLEGRGTGSRGYELAAHYVRSQC